MVVTRKTPVTPIPPVSSRTTSSQPIPRAAKAKTQSAPEQSGSLINGESQESSGHDPHMKDSPNQNGPLSQDSKPQKGSISRKDGKSRKNNLRFVDLFIRAFLLYFVTYSLSVCTKEAAFENSICRGLTQYHRLVLEPYLFPPIHAALAHPYVAPHIERMHPHVERIVAATQPIVVRAQSEWNSRIVPQWNKRVVPQWQKHASPRIRHAQKKYIEPYRLRVDREYNRRIVPHVKAAALQIKQWQHIARPYVVLAADKAHRTYQTAKPYAIPLWHKIRVTIRHLLLLLRAQRRQFVDPHVARIWDKVKELSTGKARAYTMPPVSTPSVAISTAESPEAIESTSEVAPSFTSTVILESVGEPVFHTTEAIQEPTIPTTDISESLNGESLVAKETLHLSSSVITASVHETPVPASSAIPSSTNEIYPSVLPEVPSELEPSGTTSYATPVPSHKDDEDADIDLASFYADLGLDDSDDSPDSSVLNTPPSQETESEEEKAEKLRLAAEKTAKKRADIVARHANWEERLEAQIKEKRKELRKALVAVRKAAVTELKESAEIRAQVEGFVTEAEKFLKGAEVYLKNLKKEKRKDDEKMSLWERVVGKVETKFSEKVREVEIFVNEWYMGVLNQEIQTVNDAVLPVRLFAEKAQADLGLDYAWLDDVTYQDWQRYHALVGKSDKFVDQANAIQNGSSPSPPINPVVPALADLQSEVQDIVVGFETRLRRIKRSGERAFAAGSDEYVHIDDNQQDPEATVLPMPEDPAAEGVPPVFIGRSKEEVLQAMERAESQGESERGSRKTFEEADDQVPRADFVAEAPDSHLEL